MRTINTARLSKETQTIKELRRGLILPGLKEQVQAIQCIQELMKLCKNIRFAVLLIIEVNYRAME
jgi:hypothetical protein